MISEEVKTADKDGAEWSSGQEILFAVGLGGGRVLGYQGSCCYLACTNEGPSGLPFWEDTDNIIPLREYPSEPGIYLWRGSIGAYFYKGTLDTVELKGSTSPATPEDIARLMGKHDPLPEPDDRS